MLGLRGSGSGCSGTVCLGSAVGDFARVGVCDEPGECSGHGGSGSGCWGTVCLGSAVGDFALVGVFILGAAEEGASAHTTSVPVETLRRRCQ